MSQNFDDLMDEWTRINDETMFPEAEAFSEVDSLPSRVGRAAVLARSRGDITMRTMLVSAALLLGAGCASMEDVRGV